MIRDRQKTYFCLLWRWFTKRCSLATRHLSLSIARLCCPFWKRKFVDTLERNQEEWKQLENKFFEISEFFCYLGCDISFWHSADLEIKLRKLLETIKRTLFRRVGKDTVLKFYQTMAVKIYMCGSTSYELRCGYSDIFPEFRIPKWSSSSSGWIYIVRYAIGSRG